MAHDVGDLLKFLEIHEQGADTAEASYVGY